MEIIAQLFSGILGGTLAGWLTAQVIERTRIFRALITRRSAHLSGIKMRLEHSRIKIVSSREELKPEPLGPDPLPQTSRPSPLEREAEKEALVCPSCRLEAPPALMTEHLVSSPSHRKGRVQEESKVAIPEKGGRHIRDVDDDAQRALRRLLQMMVPPRAFGRRHYEKTGNPLSEIVREIIPVRVPL
ncbi:MAG TPA: hypothetical protein VIH83_04805 [Candidatus Bathyarchaeia archaeon]